MSGCGTKQCQQSQVYYPQNNQQHAPSNMSYPSYGPATSTISQCAPVYMPSVPNAVPQFSPNATPKEKLSYNAQNAMSLEETLKFVSKDGDKLVFKAEGAFRSFTTQNVDSRGGVDQYGSQRDANTTARRESDGFYAESKVSPDGKNNIKIELGANTALVKVDIPGQKTFWLDRKELLGALDKKGQNNSAGSGNANQNSNATTTQQSQDNASNIKNKESTHSSDLAKTPEQLKAANEALATQDEIGKLHKTEAKISLGDQMLSNLMKIRTGIVLNESHTEENLRKTGELLDKFGKQVEKCLTNDADRIVKEKIVDELSIIKNLVLEKLKPYDKVIKTPRQPQNNQPGVGDAADPGRSNAGPTVGDTPDPARVNSEPKVEDSSDPSKAQSGPSVVSEPDPVNYGVGISNLSDPAKFTKYDDSVKKYELKMLDQILSYNEGDTPGLVKIEQAKTSLGVIKSRYGQEAISDVLNGFKDEKNQSLAKALNINQYNDYLAPLIKTMYGDDIAGNIKKMDDISGYWFTKTSSADALVRDLKAKGTLQATINAWSDVMNESFQSRFMKYTGYTENKYSELLK